MENKSNNLLKTNHLYILNKEMNAKQLNGEAASPFIFTPNPIKRGKRKMFHISVFSTSSQ